MENTENRKMDGFKDERLIVLPTEAIADFSQHPLIKRLYLTDVGFFPAAANHYRERKEGIDEYILIYCMKGEGIIELGREKYYLHENEAFCIPSRTGHVYYAVKDNPWTILWVHFKGEDVGLYPLDGRKVIRFLSQNALNRIQSLFELLFWVLDRNYTLGNFIYVSQVLQLILSEIYYREKGQEIPAQNKHVTNVIRYMYKNIDKELTLADISEEFQLSKSYLSAIFKSYTKKSPIEFFLELKMNEACKYLRSSDVYIYEVANMLGYSDQYYFSRIFKKIVGVSPKEYRKDDSVRF